MRQATKTNSPATTTATIVVPRRPDKSPLEPDLLVIKVSWFAPPCTAIQLPSAVPTVHRACIPARPRKTFKPDPTTTNVMGVAYSKNTAPNTVGITAHKRQRLATTSHLGLLGLRISPMPAVDANTSVAMLRRFISAVGRMSRETKRPMLTANASAPPPTIIDCSKYVMNLVNATPSNLFTVVEPSRPDRPPPKIWEGLLRSSRIGMNNRMQCHTTAHTEYTQCSGRFETLLRPRSTHNLVHADSRWRNSLQSSSPGTMNSNSRHRDYGRPTQSHPLPSNKDGRTHKSQAHQTVRG